MGLSQKVDHLETPHNNRHRCVRNEVLQLDAWSHFCETLWPAREMSRKRKHLWWSPVAGLSDAAALEVCVPVRAAHQGRRHTGHLQRLLLSHNGCLHLCVRSITLSTPSHSAGRPRFTSAAHHPAKPSWQLAHAARAAWHKARHCAQGAMSALLHSFCIPVASTCTNTWQSHSARF